MTVFWLVLAAALVFAAVSFVGAPYVPTHKAAIAGALNMLPLKKGDVVVDLGSGDGVFLVAAAKKGFKAVGYEINPLLFAASWLRLRPFKADAKVMLANFWHVKLPANTKAVFVFAAGPYMKRLANKLTSEASDRAEPLYVISYGFSLPGYEPATSKDGLHLYKLAVGKR